MPVGSCLGGQIDNNEEANNGMEVIMTSSLLNQADQFAFMQQTLLMQVRTKTSTLWFMDFSRGRVRKMLSDCWLIFWKNARKLHHSVEKSPKISKCSLIWLQIFRIHPSNGSGLSNETGSVSSRDSNSSLCPTCIAFSDHCCQRDNGSLLFHEFIEANLHYCLWDQKLADALQSLR